MVTVRQIGGGLRPDQCVDCMCAGRASISA